MIGQRFRDQGHPRMVIGTSKTLQKIPIPNLNSSHWRVRQHVRRNGGSEWCTFDSTGEGRLPVVAVADGHKCYLLVNKKFFTFTEEVMYFPPLVGLHKKLINFRENFSMTGKWN